ncbi:MAG: 16S rRNA (cytosine(1402)-N(4))-methyltransferase RsmH, partial [Candidatus Diapherotrites archaeon]|nr:16S rRNA (cytosine(1402)-N(4))-methyltransferase RsmH [Candidatus Diapherotrites archaeon]
VLDGTLGDGGHTRAIGEIIGATGRLIGLDADPEAVARAEQNLADLASAKLFRPGNFRDLDTHLSALGIDRLDRALLDLGLSSSQLADPTRGFSFQTDGPLLMTFTDGDTEGLNAARLVNELPATDLADLIARYGEEGYARRIAQTIVLARRHGPLLTTQQLVEVIASAVPKGYRFGRKHFATKTFQALRIAVNDELGALTDGLAAIWQHLNPGGRLAVISFHSLEARIVKESFRNWVRDGEGKFLTKHAIKPSREEQLRNPRSRSATLRIISKIN